MSEMRPPWGARPVLGVGMKLFLGHGETLAHARALAARADRLRDVHLFVLPSATALAPVAETLSETAIAVGAQDVHWAARGAWTGALSPLALAEVGCRYAEIGHAERRRWFGETDELVGAKLAAAVAHGLTPVLCVGWRDRAEDDDATAAARVVAELNAVLAAARTAAPGPLLVAYEPVWAIGAERRAPAARVTRVADGLRERLTDWAAPSALLYGGSVTADRVHELTGVDGVFVGRAARRADDLVSIAAAVAENLSKETHR